MGRPLTPRASPRVSTPHYTPGLLIEKNDAYTKVFSRAGLTLMWNREDSVMVGAGAWGRGAVPGGCRGRRVSDGQRRGPSGTAPAARARGRSPSPAAPAPTAGAGQQVPEPHLRPVRRLQRPAVLLGVPLGR